MEASLVLRAGRRARLTAISDDEELEQMVVLPRHRDRPQLGQVSRGVLKKPGNWKPTGR